MNKNKTPSRITFACSRGFVIPEVIIADMLSARVADTQLSPCGFGNPQGQNNPQEQML